MIKWIRNITPVLLVVSMQLVASAKEYNTNYTFIAYDDHGDFPLILVKKDDTILRYINYQSESRNLLRGDLCEFQILQDTILIAGENDRSILADFAINVRKLADGNVSKLRERYALYF